jgi:rubrerythrin
MSIEGTCTEKNLLIAFAGESQARNRYTYAASQAKKEGYVEVSRLFETTANQEKEHAKRLFKFLEGGELEIQAAFPAGKVGTTAENLREAAGGEHDEWSAMYPEFAEVARDEGLEAIAAVFNAIAVAEKNHESQFLGHLKQIESNTVFKKNEPVRWVCQNCGFVHDGLEAPDRCPACAHGQAHFMVLAGNP